MPVAYGPNSGATFANDASVGTVDWSNPSNAGASDDSYATAVLATGAASKYLKATNFGFIIPDDAAIAGIVVEPEISQSSASFSGIYASIRLVKGGTIVGTEKSPSIQIGWPTSDTYGLFGDQLDLWDVVWTPADINASDFGFVIAASNTLLEATTMRIDHIRITVYIRDRTGYGLDRRPIKVGDGMGRSDS